MNCYKCVIIDDENFTVNWLKGYIDLIPKLELQKVYTDPLDALFEIDRQDGVDLIILDINMPHLDGIELSKKIRYKTQKLLISTAHKEFGYDAFEVGADAYLLKPYSFSKFACTISKLFEDNSCKLQPVADEINDYFFVKNKTEHLKIVKIKYKDVIAVESKQNYVLIYTVTKNVLTYMSLTEIVRVLRKFENFVQFQRSFIIQKEHIDSIDGNTIKMVNGLQLTVGEYYRKDFSSFITDKMLKTGLKDKPCL